MTNSPPTPSAGSPVYCSGPMFSVGDKWEQQNVADALAGAGYTTYLPQRDGIEVGKVMRLLNHPLLDGKLANAIMLEVRKWVFALDMYQLLERCQSLVFNLDGRTPDDGSVVETAAAFTAGKPIVIYKTTPITMLAGADNPMIEGLSSTWRYAEDTTALPAALAAAVAAAKPYDYAPPANIASLIHEGSIVWGVLETLRGMPTDSPVELAAWVNAIGKRMLAHTARV
jgi:nucleoside 2-deoxyribosyltransferase